MKQSQKSVLAVLATLCIIIVLAIGFTRAAFTKADIRVLDSQESYYIAEDLSDFNAVNVSGAWQIELSQGDSWSVEVSNLEENKDRISVYVSDNTLILKQKSSGGWFSNSGSRELSARVQMPALGRLSLSGAVDAEIAKFEGELLDINTAGAVDLKATGGRYNKVIVMTAGASEIDFKNILATQASVNTTGAGDVILTLDGGELTGTIIGAGSVDYYGTVSSESIKVIGAGDISHKQ
ncbi:MAG: DUF2807 domain-containing protein [Acidiferrobacterales bacterium]|nr:DUF2807 domain-containing protein [Acidiferrobacterales bacterium]